MSEVNQDKRVDAHNATVMVISRAQTDGWEQKSRCRGAGALQSTVYSTLATLRQMFSPLRFCGVRCEREVFMFLGFSKFASRVLSAPRVTGYRCPTLGEMA